MSYLQQHRCFCASAHYYQKLYNGKQSIIDIGLTVKANTKIIPSILAVHAASGCNTVAPYHAVGKTSIIKNRLAKELKLFGNTEACIDELVTLIQIAELIDGIKKLCIKKLQKPENLLELSKPYHQLMKHFGKNVKCAHIQVATWYSTVNQHPPNLDLTFYGLVRDEVNKILCPVDIPEGVSPALKVYLLHHLKFSTQEKVTARPANLFLQRDVDVIQSEVSLK